MGLESKISGDISLGLAKVIHFLIRSPQATEVPTLGKVHDAIDEGLLKHLVAERLIDTSDEEEIEKEIEALVERHGATVLAEEFVRYRASDNLTVIIRALMRDRDREEPPTLGMVFDAISGSDILPRLVGEGEIDPDEDDTLIDEIQRLIDLHGSDVRAEEFLP